MIALLIFASGALSLNATEPSFTDAKLFPELIQIDWSRFVAHQIVKIAQNGCSRCLAPMAKALSMSQSSLMLPPPRLMPRRASSSPLWFLVRSWMRTSASRQKIAPPSTFVPRCECYQDPGRLTPARPWAYRGQRCATSRPTAFLPRVRAPRAQHKWRCLLQSSADRHPWMEKPDGSFHARHPAILGRGDIGVAAHADENQAAVLGISNAMAYAGTGSAAHF